MAQMTNAPVWLGDYAPSADERVVMRGLDWAGFQTLLALRGDRPRPRMAYLDGTVEIMGTSRDHENIKSRLGRLVEAYCLARGILFNPYGSWHLEDESEEAGAEPDECYVFGTNPKTQARPDLVIEVVWTSGGIKKLEVYRRLGIAEVWFWQFDNITVHVLTANGYVASPRSARLPDLDLGLLCRLVQLETTNEAIEQLLASVRAP